MNGGCDDQIIVSFQSSNWLIENNTVRNGDKGIKSDWSYNGIIRNNFIDNMTVRVDDYYIGIYILGNDTFGTSKNINITDNVINRSTRAGI